MTGLLSRIDDQRNIKLFRESVDAAGQGIALIGGDGNVIYSNTTYGILTGLNPDSPVPVWKHYHGGYEDKVRNLILPMVVAGEGWTGELQILGAEGTTIDTIESFVPVDTIPGDTSYIINMITDISDRKKLEAQLINARKEAEIANRAKSDYLANMSHEIRTPMNAVIGLAFLALQTELDSRQRDYIIKINTAAKSLLNIINDILDLSKIEAGRLELESAPFSLDEVLESAADMAAETARDKGLRLLYVRPPELPDRWIGDRFRLGQVLLNLVGNAVKFTNEGRVVLSVNSDVPGYLRFIVEDTGIGMTEEQISRLFNPFQQADASISREFGGTGLGLTISRQIVELMNGTISVSSIPSKGSRFEFTVSMTRDHDAPLDPVLIEPGSSGSAVVLSSDILNREFHFNALTAIGYNTTATGSLKEVLENPDIPDLLVLDLDDCCKNPKAAAYALSEGAKESFILVLSGSRTEAELSAFVPEGIQHVILPVPYRKTRLKDAIAELGDQQKISTETQQHRGSSAISARILLADDNAINRQVGFELLSSAGLSVDLAVDGKEAVSSCNNEDYNLIFMDLRMPEMDGYEATKIIRKDHPDTPIIAMTASTLNDVKSEIRDAGFSGYIAKPVDPDSVFRLLSEKLNIPESIFKSALREGSHRSDKRKSIEGIDETQLLKQLLGDREQLDGVLGMFVDRHSGESEIIKKGPGDDPEELISLLHYLRGSAGHLGAAEIMRMSGQLEDKLRRGEATDPDSFRQLAEKLSELLTSISGVITKNTIDSKLLDELENLIRRSDESVGVYLEEKITVWENESNRHYIEKIRTALNRWNFDQALDVVDDWRVSTQNSSE